MLIGALAPYDGWMARIQTAASTDADSIRLRKRAMKEDPKTNSDAYILVHDALYYRTRGTLRVYAPKSLFTSFLHEFHNAQIAGLVGWMRTYLAVSQHYWRPKMSECFRCNVVQCPVCQLSKPTNQPAPPIRPLSARSKPFECTTLDSISGVPPDEDGNDSLLHLVDSFSYWAISVPCDKHMSSAKQDL